MFNTYNMHPQDDRDDDQELPHMFQHLLSLMYIQAQEIEAQEIKAQENETLERWFALSPDVN